ncbi:MAG: biotin/lipoyl-binding protein [Syntrophobacteraceae bacterium]
MDAQKISGLTIADSEQFSVTRRRPRTLWIILIAAGAVAILLYAFQAGFLTSATNVRTAGADWVYPSQVITEFNASGYVVAQRKASVASKGTGRIVYLGVQEGSRVKEGEVLARLDSDDLKAEKAQLEAQLVVARFDLTRAETELATAEANFKRLKELWGKKASSQVDLENAQDRFLKAKAAIDSAKANIKAVQASIQRESVLIEYSTFWVGHKRQGSRSFDGRPFLSHGASGRWRIIFEQGPNGSALRNSVGRYSKYPFFRSGAHDRTDSRSNAWNRNGQGAF